MTFTVTYRDKDGARREECVGAANRAECLAALKERGIVPVSVREGRASARPRSGKNAASPNGGTRSSIIVRAAILAAVVLAVVGGAWWLLSRREAEDGGRAAPRHDVAQVEAPKDAVRPDQPADKPRQATPVPTTHAPPSGGAAARSPAEEKPRKQTMAERGIRVAKPRKELRPRRFKYNAEEHIAFFLETEPGDVVFGEIPYGQKFVEDFKASLREPVAILPEDSEDVRQLKRSVQEMKEELKAKMDAGEDIAQIMRDARRQLVELGNYRTSLEDELKRIARGGEFNEEEFEKFVNAANKMLEEKGLSPIKPTRMMYKMLELKARRSKRQ